MKQLFVDRKEGSDMDTFPPIAKIYEAYSAIADGRVEMSDTKAYVESSDHKKCYTVRFDDYATLWQHYAG